MIPISAGTVLLTFLLFCRIGGCIMLMPGFGSPRVPVNVRVFLAVSVTLALAPVLIPVVEADLAKVSAVVMAQLVISETLVGGIIGIMGRIFMLALQFAGTATASLIGFSGMADPPIEDNEAAPAIATLFTLTATVLVFATGLHVEIFRALIASYQVVHITDVFDTRFALAKVTDASADSFLLVAQLASPFLVYSLVVNFLFGVMNKLSPLIPVYFISAPFVLAGGLILLFFTFGEALKLFLSGFQNFLVNG